MKLTQAQRRILAALCDTEFKDFGSVGCQRRTRIILNNSGLTEPARMGPITIWSSIRRTAAGTLALAATA